MIVRVDCKLIWRNKRMSGPGELRATYLKINLGFGSSEILKFLPFSLKDDVSCSHTSLSPPPGLVGRVRLLGVCTGDKFTSSEWASEHTASQEFWNVSKVGYTGGKYMWGLLTSAQCTFALFLVMQVLIYSKTEFSFGMLVLHRIHHGCTAGWCQ